MSTIEAPRKSWTVEEFLALPDDGRERWMIAGQLREAHHVTRRSWVHSSCLAKICAALVAWKESLPLNLAGEVVAGEAGFRLPSPDVTLVGIDIAYIDARLAATLSKSKRLIDGSPLLAVEILSSSDVHEQVLEKIHAYLEAGVKLVWIVDPELGTITVIEPGQEPVLFNRRQVIVGGEHLPGFEIPVSRLMP